MSTLSGQEHAEYGEHESPPTETRPGASQDRRSTYSGHQQYSNLAAEGSSRVHAGNSYVEHQTNCYTPPTLAHQPFFGPDYERVQKINALRIALEFPERHLRQAKADFCVKYDFHTWLALNVWYPGSGRAEKVSFQTAYGKVHESGINTFTRPRR
jgi:hypothetical protein